MKASELLLAIQQELRRHSWDTFVDEPPSMAEGGKGIVVPGCLLCKKKINTTPEFIHHIIQDVLPAVFERALADTGMRPEECFRLCWDNVTWVNGRNGVSLVTRGKTASAPRVLPVAKNAINAVQ